MGTTGTETCKYSSTASPSFVRVHFLLDSFHYFLASFLPPPRLPLFLLLWKEAVHFPLFQLPVTVTNVTRDGRWCHLADLRDERNTCSPVTASFCGAFRVQRTAFVAMEYHGN